jgi:phosphoglycolate phosphatase
MIKDVKTVLFDLDGTITDPFQGITNSVAYALKSYGIQVKDKRELQVFIGPPLYASFMKYYGFSKEKSMEAVERYREYYSNKGVFECALYPGIRELLKKLNASGKKVVLATSKPEFFAKQILEHFNIDKHFSFLAGATMDSRRVEKADIIKYAFENLSDNTSFAVMIGDREFDILGAKDRGIFSIGVTYGYGNREELLTAGADYICESVEDIEKILL